MCDYLAYSILQINSSHDRTCTFLLLRLVELWNHKTDHLGYSQQETLLLNVPEKYIRSLDVELYLVQAVV